VERYALQSVLSPPRLRTGSPLSCDLPGTAVRNRIAINARGRLRIRFSISIMGIQLYEYFILKQPSRKKVP
jgi:hypothetical protein